MNQDPLIGKILANFRIEQRLGQGGMATVYLGMDTQLDRPVAIKIINTMYQDEPEFARRFVDEAKIVARWRHENIISVYYADQDDGLYYFVMEYIEGATLEDLLKNYIQEGHLTPHDDVIRIGRDVANALDYAHEQGIVHRDMKPSNIMISRDNRVVLTDFGLALDMGQGSMGQVFGTPHYISPEQARRSADAVPQSDIYGLGIILYEMLTGAIPFDDPSATAIAVQHVTQAPPAPTYLNPALNQQTEDVLLKALSKNPEERYKTANELIDALADALATINTENEEAQSVLLPPAAITKQRNAPTLSRVSISDMLALELNDNSPLDLLNKQNENTLRSNQQSQQSVLNPTEKTNELRTKVNPTVRATKPNENKHQMGILVGLGVAIVAIIIVAIIILALNFGNDNTPEIALDVTNTDTPTSVIEVSELTVENTVAAIATVTNAPTEDTVATIASINATNDAIATSNAQQEAILTQQASQVTANAVENDSPTQAFPNGNLLELTYNSGGFYLRNSSDETISDSRLAFQAINSSSSGVSEPFNGTEWAQFYGNIDSNGRCVAIELLDQSSWTRPANCVAPSGAEFNSQLTFPTDDERIFWLAEDGAVQFVVFWDNVEIARCEIAEGFCQVRVGN